jgi:hypothetical protein
MALGSLVEFDARWAAAKRIYSRSGSDVKPARNAIAAKTAKARQPMMMQPDRNVDHIIPPGSPAVIHVFASSLGLRDPLGGIARFRRAAFLIRLESSSVPTTNMLRFKTKSTCK